MVVRLSMQCQHARVSEIRGGILLLCLLCGCGGSSGLLGDLLPSEAEVSAYEQEVAAFNDRVDALPSVDVRVVNETVAVAKVTFSVSMTGPQFPDPLGDFYGDLGEPSLLTPIDTPVILVTAGGTVTGKLKCGEVISISAIAPADHSGFDAYSNSGDPFGTFGNIDLDGAGTVPDGTFSGDRITTTRILHPDADGLTCLGGSLEVRIQTVGAPAIIDPQTGETVVFETAGTGVITVE